MSLNNLIQSLTSSNLTQIKSDLLKHREHCFDLRPKQKEFSDGMDIFTTSKKTLIGAYGGGMGSGKTYLFIMMFYELALLYPGSKWTISRETLQRAKETVWPDLKKIGGKLVKRFYESTSTGFRALLHNGSIIELKGENIHSDPDLDAWKSYNTNGIFIEQGEEVTQEFFEMCIMRSGRWRLEPMPPAFVFVSLNPSNTWVKEYFYDRYKKGNLPDNIIYVPATIKDNPTLYEDEAYMSKFDNLDPLTKQRYLDGDWDAFKGKNPFAHCFSEVKHVGPVEENPDENIYLSFDFNHDPCTVTIWQHYDNKIRCLNELKSSVGLGDLCRQIRDYIGFTDGELDTICFVTGDKSGWNKSELIEGNRTAYDIISNELGLTKYQMQTPKQNPNMLKSRELTNSLFEHADVLISDRCKQLIFDLKFVSCDDKHQIIKDRNKPEGKADWIDGLRYYFASYHSDFIRF